VNRLTRLVLGLAIPVLVSGPATAGPERSATGGRLQPSGVLLLPVRVDVYEVAPAGVTLLKAEWTQHAQDYVRAALGSVLAGRTAIVPYQAPADPEHRARHAQVMKVHALLRSAIIAHRYTEGWSLPSKARFEWSLGPGASVLRDDRTAAPYAMFVEMSEHRLSRHFVTFGGLANEFSGSASIVDLAAGDIVWFNYERTGAVGTAPDALATMKRLLHDLPF
jgi:hypothetical protein